MACSIVPDGFPVSVMEIGCRVYETEAQSV